MSAGGKGLGVEELGAFSRLLTIGARLAELAKVGGRDADLSPLAELADAIERETCVLAGVAPSERIKADERLVVIVDLHQPTTKLWDGQAVLLGPDKLESNYTDAPCRAAAVAAVLASLSRELLDRHGHYEGRGVVTSEVALSDALEAAFEDYELNLCAVKEAAEELNAHGLEHADD